MKHDIEVFDVCCDLSTILLSFEVYVGQKDDFYNKALEICDELVKEARLTSSRWRMLYTDNYYMPMALAKHMFNNYRWTIIGTIVPTG